MIVRYRLILSFNRYQNLRFFSSNQSSMKKKDGMIEMQKLRNIGIIAHVDAGKTTTTENMLYHCGTIGSVGRVDTGDTVTDFLPVERERGITVQSAAISMTWKNHNINLIDTPGHVDFTVEVERAVRAIDGCVLVLDAVAGVQAQTMTVWRQAEKQGIAALAFVNKMDRNGASFEDTIKSLKVKLGSNAIPLQYPLFSPDNSFIGIVDLIGMNKIEWKNINERESESEIVSKKDPYYDDVIEARRYLLESLAEVNESFMEIYLNATEIEAEDDIELPIILSAIRSSCINREILPVMCGSSLKNKGVDVLLNSVISFFPSPLERLPCKLHPVPQPQSKYKQKKSSSKGEIIEKEVKEIAPDSKVVCGFAFKVTYDPQRGKLVFVRVFSGKLDKKDMIFNTTQGIRDKVLQVCRVKADYLEQVDSVSSGNVTCLVGLKHTNTGDTLVSEKGPLKTWQLATLDVPKDVFSIAVEPELSSQQDALDKALEILCIEDPSLRAEVDEESGQTIIAGIGELHLEIVRSKLLDRFKIPIITAAANIAYRESLIEDVFISSQWFTFSRSIGNKQLFAKLQYSIKSTTTADDPSYKIHDIVKEKLKVEEIDSLEKGLEGAFSRGPRSFPVCGIDVQIEDVEINEYTTPGALLACSSLLVDETLRSDDYTLLEPRMAVEVAAPGNHLGDILSELTTRRAEVREVNTDGYMHSIDAVVPLATMIGYATTVRSLTQGEGSYSMNFLDYTQVDPKIMEHDYQQARNKFM